MQKLPLLYLIAATSLVGADINKLATECAAGKVKSCAKLVELAKTDKKSEVRLAAVEKIVDQSALAEIARAQTAQDVRLAAVKKLTDEAMLADIARNDDDTHVRTEAVKKVNDQATLAAIARACRASTDAKFYYAQEVDLRDLVLDRISDPTVLLDLAKTTAGSTPHHAMKRLGKVSPALLVSTAKTPAGGPSDAAVAFGVQSLESPELLADVARNARAPVIRAAAVRRLSNQEALEAFARSDKEPLVRTGALQTLKDSSLAAKIRAVEADPAVRCSAAPPVLFVVNDPDWTSVRLNGSFVQVGFGRGETAVPLSEGDQKLSLGFTTRRYVTENMRLVEETITATNDKTFSAHRGYAFTLRLNKGASILSDLSEARLVAGPSGGCIAER